MCPMQSLRLGVAENALGIAPKRVEMIKYAIPMSRERVISAEATISRPVVSKFRQISQGRINCAGAAMPTCLGLPIRCGGQRHFAGGLKGLDEIFKSLMRKVEQVYNIEIRFAKAAKLIDEDGYIEQVSCYRRHGCLPSLQFVEPAGAFYVRDLTLYREKRATNRHRAANQGGGSIGDDVDPIAMAALPQDRCQQNKAKDGAEGEAEGNRGVFLPFHWVTFGHRAGQAQAENRARP